MVVFQKTSIRQMVRYLFISSIMIQISWHIDFREQLLSGSILYQQIEKRICFHSF